MEHDDRPEWLETARKFKAVLREGQYDAYISAVVIDEIKATKDKIKQDKLVKHINDVGPTFLPFDEEAFVFAEQYIAIEFVGSRSQGVYNDCRHVAVATVNGIAHIVSFNCKHLVNDHRIDGFNAINFKSGHDQIIDISMPHKYLNESNEVKS